MFGAAASLGIIYTLLASALVGRFFARSVNAPAQFPGVTVVKPLHGDEWQLSEHLESFFNQDYPGPVQFLFGVHDANDAALKRVEALRARYPQAAITIVADGRLYGPNRKIANLVNMLEHAGHDILCFADSDVRVDRSYLRKVVGTLGEPGVGLVTTVYRGLCAPGFWPRVGAALTNYHFLPGVVTGVAIGRARPCFGQTIALTRQTLDAIGGLRQFAHHLAEDHALGEAVRRIGKTVAIPPLIVEHACVEDTFTDFFTHELRWSRTIRAADRSGHLGAVLMHPLPLALLALAFSGGAAAACLIACAALLARALLVMRVDRATRSRTRGLWNLPLCDMLQFAVYLASFGSSGVVWRGIRFSVDGNGMLSPVRDE
ncbi:bacteriohopanetetrol glucosamine biosynthesis glycosyltransferase HpnI [Burkholderia sp. Ax-1719]|uniref:bacteriohopanetetrol glucosamine biosynthesis glycosyltransferase HpnI n=1 Tax=Burkholderia sp. Ax-1719 TaxID=2608334 RepID=UPI001F04C593|nr:bacteriohopanetetrol glucosamine biosynthesis glycosyltransferase HpnI [Burkholderia sp. Ax-1719]